MTFNDALTDLTLLVFNPKFIKASRVDVCSCRLLFSTMRGDTSERRHCDKAVSAVDRRNKTLVKVTWLLRKNLPLNETRELFYQQEEEWTISSSDWSHENTVARWLTIQNGSCLLLFSEMIEIAFSGNLTLRALTKKEETENDKMSACVTVGGIRWFLLTAPLDGTVWYSLPSQRGDVIDDCSQVRRGNAHCYFQPRKHKRQKKKSSSTACRAAKRN